MCQRVFGQFVTGPLAVQEKKAGVEHVDSVPSRVGKGFEQHGRRDQVDEHSLG